MLVPEKNQKIKKIKRIKKKIKKAQKVCYSTIIVETALEVPEFSKILDYIGMVDVTKELALLLDTKDGILRIGVTGAKQDWMQEFRSTYEFTKFCLANSSVRAHAKGFITVYLNFSLSLHGSSVRELLERAPTSKMLVPEKIK